MARAKQEILTGLLYIDPDTEDIARFDCVRWTTPLNDLLRDYVRESDALELINQSLRSGSCSLCTFFYFLVKLAVWDDFSYTTFFILFKRWSFSGVSCWFSNSTISFTHAF